MWVFLFFFFFSQVLLMTSEIHFTLNACIWALQKFLPEQVHPGVKRGCVRESPELPHTSFLGNTVCSPTHTCIPTGMAPGALVSNLQEPKPCPGCASEERVCSPTTRITAWDVLSMKRPSSAETALPVGCHPAVTFWGVSALQPHGEFSSLLALLTSCFLHSSAPPWMVLGVGL